MGRILIADDEAKIRALVRKYGSYEGHEVEEASNGRKALEMALSRPYDLIILDVMMPELDGLSTCRAIRRKSEVPILMLSARGEEYDRISGFELGADDYVVKPFSPKELMLRVEAILRRTGKIPLHLPGPEDPTHEVMKFGGLTVDFTARLVFVDGEKAYLSPKEYDLLFYFCRNHGIALSREKLLTEVWGYDFYGDDRTLDTHIKMLRKSLGSCRKRIVTLRGVGYRFDDN